MLHVHITANGETIGTLALNALGRVIDGGTPAAINAIDYTAHGFRREHGQLALDAIVDCLDRATLVGAYYCSGDCEEVGAT